MNAIKATWKTLTDTLKVVTQYGSYGLYPLLSFIIMLLVTFTLMIPLLNSVLEIAEEGASKWIFLSLVVYFIYGALYFVTAFFNVALVSSLAGQLDGEAPPLNRGVAKALQRIRPIALYSLASATLGLVSSLAKRLLNPFFGNIVAPSLGKGVWLRWRNLSHTIPLLMAVPVIALDQPVPENVFKRGELLVKETWGERVNPAPVIGQLPALVRALA